MTHQMDTSQKQANYKLLLFNTSTKSIVVDYYTNALATYSTHIAIQVFVGAHYFTERTGPDRTKFTHYSPERNGRLDIT